MMRSINQIFQYNKHLLDEPEVVDLIEYTNTLEEELFELKMNDTVMESKLAFLVRDIYTSVSETMRMQEHKERFNIGEDIDFRSGIRNLKTYIEEFSRDEKFKLNK